MKKIILNMVSLCMAFCLFTGCSGADTEEDRNRTQLQGIVSEQENTDQAQQPEGDAAVEPQQNTQMDTETEKSEEMEAMLQMKIGDTVVAVDWENNESVEALKALCQEGPLTIQMSMYGGFEQVGPIGSRLPSADVQTRPPPATSCCIHPIRSWCSTAPIHGPIPGSTMWPIGMRPA